MSPSDPSNRDLDRLDLDEVRRFLVGRWRVILGAAFGCAVLAAIVCLSVTPVYTATSQVLLDPRKQHVFGQDAVAQDSVLDSSIVDSQIPIILSTGLLAKVVNKEHLADDSEFDGPAKQGLVDRIFGAFRSKRQTQVELPSFDGIDSRLQPVILHLFDKIDVSRVAKSYVISISVSSRDAAKAMRLANSLAETYTEDQVDVRAKSVGQTAAFFEDRLGNLRDQVRASEQAVADFRHEHNLTTTQMDGKVTVGEQQLQNLNEQLALAATDTAEKTARYEQGAHFKLDHVDLDTLPDIIRSPVIAQLRTQQADLTRRAADLSAMYGPAYPAISQMQAQRAGLEKAIAAEMKRLVSTLKNDSEVAKAREDSLRATIAALTDVSGGDNEVGVKLRELERTNLANKALFENFLNRAKLAQEQSTFEEPDARLISPALEPAIPSFPKTKLILPVSFVAGLIFGLGLGALLDLVRRRSVAPAALPAVGANAFILARIPEIATSRGVRPDCLHRLESQPNSYFAHSIDLLAKRLAPASGESRIVLLAPLAAGEGATSLALCLAAAAGKAGLRVLLVDADQAGRGLSSAIGSAGKPGLAEVIAGEISANKAVVPQSRFAVMPAGQKPVVSAKEAKRLGAFLTEARGRFDMVLVDAPVFDAGADVAALVALADGVALVTCWEHLLRDAFIAAIDSVAERPNFLGLILNRTAPAAAEADDVALAS